MIRRDYLIIGGGVGGGSTCEAIRRYDKKGSVTLVGGEPYLPYQRPALSKSFLRLKNPSVDDLLHLRPTWFSRNKIELRLNTIVTELNVDRHLAVLSTGQTIEFKKACLATGCRPHRPPIAGATLGNIIYLRSVRDAIALREVTADTKKVVVVGGGFIALEASAALRERKSDVTLMSRDQYLWQKLLDQETARWLTGYFELKGVNLMMRESLNGFEGKTILRNIQTKSGNRFPAGIALVALGADLNLELVQNTPLSSPSGTPVTEHLETEEKGVYAVGDIALYPDRVFGGVRRTTHWENAVEQGRVAGGNMTGRRRQKFESVPHFTSEVFDLKFEFTGDFSLPPQRVELEGDYTSKKFIAHYYQGDKLTGIVCCNRRPLDRSRIVKKFRGDGKK